MVNVEGSLSADLIAQQNFGAARRGFDPDEVRAFLVKVAAEIVTLHERQTTLEDARRDAEYRAAHPSFDEDTLLGAVGEETAHILKSAHEAASDIKIRAEENASRILKEAHQRAEALRGEAETVLARRSDEAEAVADRIRETARSEAERLVDQARQQAKAIRSQAEAERTAMIEGAQVLRDKILSALSKKRNVAVAQVEALRAGRERLLESYQVVRETLEEATHELARAEAEARAAADAVRHRPLALDEPDGLEDDSEPTNPTLPIVQKRIRTAVAGSPPPPPAARPAVQPSAPQPGRIPHAPGGPVAPRTPSDASAPPPQLSKPTGAPNSSPVRSGASASNADVRPPVPAAAAPGQTTSAPAMSAESAHARPAPSADPNPDPISAPATPVTAPATPVTPTEAVFVATGDRAPGAVVPMDVSARPNGAGSSAPEDTATSGAGAGAGDERPSGSGSSPAPSGTVESLFARIRADRERAVSHAREVLADDAPVGDRPVGNTDESLLQRRDEMVGPIESSLTRRLKRALQDDQNDLLDRLRGLRSSQKAANVVLLDRDAHAARFREVGRPFLSEAVTAGVAFTASLIPGLRPSEHLGGLDHLADDLSGAIVDPLRRRLESVLAAGEGDDPVVLAEAVGGAYREWKTKRVEVVAADQAAAAFAAGAYAAAPPGTALRWLVDDPEGPCPDCDDNVLAGEQAKGEPFPTGQRHPPAHPGCRCVLVPEPTAAS